MPTVLNLSGRKVLAEKSNSFEPLPAGTYGVSIYDVKAEEIAAGKRNAGDTSYNIQFKVLDGQTGANRRHFERILIAPTWVEFGEKEEQDNFTFINFIAALRGVAPKVVRAELDAATKGEGEFSVPTPKDLLGKKLNLTLDVKEDPFGFRRAKERAEEQGEEFDKNPTDFKRNNVKKFAPYAEVEKEKPSLSGFAL